MISSAPILRQAMAKQASARRSAHSGGGGSLGHPRFLRGLKRSSTCRISGWNRMISRMISTCQRIWNIQVVRKRPQARAAVKISPSPSRPTSARKALVSRNQM